MVRILPRRHWQTRISVNKHYGRCCSQWRMFLELIFVIYDDTSHFNISFKIMCRDPFECCVYEFWDGRPKGVFFSSVSQRKVIGFRWKIKHAEIYCFGSLTCYSATWQWNKKTRTIFYSNNHVKWSVIIC